MRYLHTMVRSSNLDETLNFYCNKLGLVEVRRHDSDAGRYTNIFLCAPEDMESAEQIRAPLLEITYNWDAEEFASSSRNFGHLAFAVDNIYELCQSLSESGITINRPPRDGHMAFVLSPDGISIELLQAGESLPRQEPWASMENRGSW